MELKKRVITAIFMFLIFAPLFFLGSYFTYGLMIVLSFIGTFEVVRMHNTNNAIPKCFNFIIPAISSLIVAFTMLATKIFNNFQYKYVYFGLLILVIGLFILPTIFKRYQIGILGYYVGIVAYISLGFSTIGLIRDTYETVTIEYILANYNINIYGLSLFGFVLASTLCTDMGAYTFGRHFGKHKLAPKVSPHKTIEGSIGGSLFGALAGTIELIVLESYFKFNFGLTGFINILLTFVVALSITVVSQCGDLIASKLKRDHNIKDYGNIFPGHGGVMDRFDSLILSAIYFSLILIIFGVIA